MAATLELESTLTDHSYQTTVPETVRRATRREVKHYVESF